MNGQEQQRHKTAVQRLEADFHRTREDLTTLLEGHLRASQQMHLAFVRQHEMVISKQAKEVEQLRTDLSRLVTETATAEARRVTDLTCVNGTAVLRRGFWGRLNWLCFGS